jgi:hypothetical protein
LAADELAEKLSSPDMSLKELLEQTKYYRDVAGVPKKTIWEHGLYSKDRVTGDEEKPWTHAALVKTLIAFAKLFEQNKIEATSITVSSFLPSPPVAHRGTRTLKVLTQASAKMHSAYISRLCDVILETLENLQIAACHSFIAEHRPEGLEGFEGFLTEAEPDTPQTSQKPERFLNKRMRKQFDTGLFVGVVKSYSKRRRVFKILYADGDAEEMDQATLEPLLMRPGSFSLGLAWPPHHCCIWTCVA